MEPMEGFTCRETAIDVGDAVLRGEIYLPAGEGPFPAAILLHGMAAGRKIMRPAAQELAVRGIAALIYDLRGHGDSGGVYAGQGAEDVRKSIHWLAAQPFVMADRIGLVGHSLGGRLVLIAAAQEPCVAAVVALAPAPDLLFQDLAKDEEGRQFLANPPREVIHYPGTEVPGANNWDGWRLIQNMRLNGYRMSIIWADTIATWNAFPLEKAVRFRPPRPLLLVHGVLDQAAPYRYTWRLARAACPPCKLWTLPFGIHSTPYGRQARRQWIRWLDRHLRGAQAVMGREEAA
jgi:dipeptidyl aminopeptidase/acylaminoacyl peptidase